MRRHVPVATESRDYRYLEGERDRTTTVYALKLIYRPPVITVQSLINKMTPLINHYNYQSK